MGSEIKKAEDGNSSKKRKISGEGDPNSETARRRTGGSGI